MTQDEKIVPVILAGGSGTRLWPLSREYYPKQLLALVNEQTMLQNTLLRAEGIPGVADPIIVCTEEHRFLVAEQAREMRRVSTIIIEPVGRDTAPAVTAAANVALEDGDDPILLVLPADHVIERPEIFFDMVEKGAAYAAAGYLVTFGVVPKNPHTGYGYIQQGKAVTVGTMNQGYAVRQFVEKPDADTANCYVEEGFLWNSGMFLAKASTFLAELKQFEPEMAEYVKQSCLFKTHDLDFTRLEPKSFAASTAKSIDYAVMERSAKSIVLPLDCGWSDVGSWAALWEIGEQDENGNVFSGNVMAEDVHGCYIQAKNSFVAAVGLKDHVVIETKDAVLVAPKTRAQDVKAIVRRLQTDDREEAKLHKTVFRPWGSYECLDCGDRFQVKRIIVKPQARLSLQRHFHRAEHWVVVKGTAQVTNGDNWVVLSENQSTYIPLGQKHRLENPGTIPLEIIEIQTGSYLGEDDIERFDDVYGR